MGLAESFRILGMAKSPGAAPALTQVLWAQDVHLATMAAEALLTSPTPRGSRALVTGFPRLPKPAQDLVASRLYRLKDEIRSAVVSEDPGRRAGALELLTSSTSTDILPLICYFLGDSSPGVRARALTAYVTAALRFASEYQDFIARSPSALEGSGPLTGTAALMAERLSAARQSLVTALGELKVHGDLRVVRAALEIGEPAYDALGEAVRRGGDVEGGNRILILRYLLDDGSIEASRFLFWLLGHRQQILRKQGARVFAGRDEGVGRESVAELLREMDADQIRKLVRLNRGFPWMLPLEGSPAGILPDVFPVLERELDKVQIPATDRAVWLRLLADCPDSGVSGRSLAALGRLGEDAASPQFIQLVGSRRDSVALAAIEFLGRARHGDLAKAVAPRINSDNPQLAAISRRVIARRSFERIIEKWEVLDPTVRTAAGFTIMALDPDAAMLLLPELHHTEGLRRARAAHIALALGLVRRLRIHIARMIEDPSPRARATAISAMGSLGDARYFDELRRMLSDVDQRVRSNLIEALGRCRAASHREWIEPFLQSPVARQRVNAAVALVRMGFQADGLGRLEEWLRSPDQAIRLGAAYGLGESGLPFCKGVLQDAMARERDQAVSGKMAAALAKLDRQGAQDRGVEGEA